jgi:8-oxo-dGTP diphosphatase
MPPRPKTPAATAAGASLALDLVAFTIGEAALEVLLVREPGRAEGWQLPTAHYLPPAPLREAASRFAGFVLGSPPTWFEQVGAESEGQHPLQAALSIGWVTAVPRGTATAGDAAWHPVDALPGTLGARQQALVARAHAQVRQRLDHAPVAFHFLPPVFTLSGLQEVYERLLGRAVHKASFRRALAGAALVAPTEEWRSEGRGRPAQLFTLAPKPRSRRGVARAIRFDFPVD